MRLRDARRIRNVVDRRLSRGGGATGIGGVDPITASTTADLALSDTFGVARL